MIKSAPYKRPGYVYSVSAIQWDFHIRSARLGSHIKANTHPDDRRDIYLTKKKIDPIHLGKTSLFNIGGYFHFHTYDKNAIWIEEGVPSIKTLENPHIGILNFEEIEGEVTCHKLKKENIIGTGKFRNMSEMVYIKLPGVDFTDKLVGVSLLGELYWIGLDSFIATLVGTDKIKLNLEVWGLYEKIYHLKEKFGKKPNMGLTPYKDKRISVDEVTQDDFIRYILTLPQTFVVTVDTPKPVKMWYSEVAGHQLPWRYRCYEHHYRPLRMSDGRYMPYVAQKKERGFSLCTTSENRVYPQINDTLIRADQRYLNEANISSQEGILRRAQFLNMCFLDHLDQDIYWTGDNRTYYDLLLNHDLAKQENSRPPSGKDKVLGIHDPRSQWLSNNILVCGKGWYYSDDRNICVKALGILDENDNIIPEELMKLTPSEQLSFIEGIYGDGYPSSHSPEFYVWDDAVGFKKIAGDYKDTTWIKPEDDRVIPTPKEKLDEHGNPIPKIYEPLYELNPTLPEDPEGLGGDIKPNDQPNTGDPTPFIKVCPPGWVWSTSLNRCVIKPK